MPSGSEPILQYLWFVGSLPYLNPPSFQPPGWAVGLKMGCSMARSPAGQRWEGFLFTGVLGLIGEDLGSQLLGVQELWEAPHHGLHQAWGEDAT